MSAGMSTAEQVEAEYENSGRFFGQPAERPSPTPAEREREAHLAYRQASERVRHLSGPGPWHDVDGAQLDPIDRAVKLDEAQAREATCIRAFKRARDEANAARVAAANEQLPGLLERHAHAAEEAEAALAELEEAWLALTVASWRAVDAFTAEGQAARDVVKAAKPALPSEDERGRAILASTEYRIPAEVGDDRTVTEWRRRPSHGLWGGSLEVGSASAFRQLAEIAAVGYAKGRALHGRKIAPLFERAWQHNETR